MHPFGGTSICPRCSKAVYAAEQVMGPGRKLYHKPCLACTNCGVRLDSFRLLEHDELPYCKNCHSKNFGTRDLRQANLPHTPKDLSPSPPRATATSPTSPLRRVLTPPPSPSKPSAPPSASGRPLFPSLTINRKDTGAFGDSTSFPGPLLRPTRVLSPTRGAFNADSEQIDSTDSSTDQGSDDSQFTPSHVGRSENGLPRTVPLIGTGTPDRVVSPTKPTAPAPASTGSLATLGRAHSVSGNGALGARRIAPLAASATGTRYGAALMGELRSTPTGSPVRQWGGGTPQCPRCSKNVYFAEQVKAVGKTWHKACLRCSECGTSLDSSRLTEKDGAPFCHRCYNKLHGPAGSGYALLGKAGG
ncbi:hypothetical protein V8E52_005434 [Russula decolorans]